MDINFLKNIYRNLYEQNLVAAEEDYLEYYEPNFAPDSIGLDEMDEEEQVSDALVRLVGEIYDDTGDEAQTREWLIDAGADDAILALCDV